MVSRICGNCYDSVTFRTFDVPFACVHCGEKIIFKREETHLAPLHLIEHTKDQAQPAFIDPNEAVFDIQELQPPSSTPDATEEEVIKVPAPRGKKKPDLSPKPTASSFPHPPKVELDNERVPPQKEDLEEIGEQIHRVSQDLSFEEIERIAQDTTEQSRLDQEHVENEDLFTKTAGGNAEDALDAIFDITEVESRPSELPSQQELDASGIIIREDPQAEAKDRLKEKKRQKITNSSRNVLLSVTAVAVTFIFIQFLINSNVERKSALETSRIEIEQNAKETQAFLKMIDQDQVIELMNEYFASTSALEAGRFILPDLSIDNILKKYWKPKSFDNIRVTQSQLLEEYEGSLFYVECTNDKDSITEIYPVFFLKGMTSPLIDWRFPNQIEDMPITDIFADKVTGKVRVRCMITQEDFYNYGYFDKSKWMSCSIWDINNYLESSSTRIDAYLDRESADYQAILNELVQQSGYARFREQEVAKDVTLSMLEDMPESVDKLYSKPARHKQNKSFARAIIEIDIKDGELFYAEVTKLVSADILKYFVEYQLPFLNLPNDAKLATPSEEISE